jgi:hypothetical protein
VCTPRRRRSSSRPASEPASAPFCNSARSWYQLTDVDGQSSHPEQYAGREQHADQDPEGTSVVGAEQNRNHRADERWDQVSHGMTPRAVSVVWPLKPVPPKRPTR